MSVAAIQQQLARGSVGEIELRPYLTDLCRSIGASMITDPEQFSLQVDADGTIVASEIAISLGLIVTELVINALKHGFPDQRHGEIKVDYHSDGVAWALSVSDDGVGMPPASADSHIGLGTTIIQALAKKLDASVEISDAKPGTKVSIVSD